MRRHTSPRKSAAKTRPISIVIVDGDHDFGSARPHPLGEERRLNVQGCFQDPRRALEQIRRLQPDIVLMDLRVNGPSGVKCLKTLQKESPSIHTIVVAEIDDSRALSEAMAAGASGYLTKPFTAEECLRAIEFVLAGGLALSRRLAERLSQAPVSNGGLTKPSNINSRERLVLEQLAQGLRDSEIADRLSMSLPVVHKLLRRTYRKLGVQNRTQAVNAWRREGPRARPPEP